LTTFYGLVLSPRLKKIPLNLVSQFAALGANVPAFVNILKVTVLPRITTLGPNNKPKKFKVGSKFDYILNFSHAWKVNS
jgi:hypothetical protein